MPERYPPEDPREWLNRAEEYEEALTLAEEVVRWAEEQLRGQESKPEGTL